MIKVGGGLSRPVPVQRRIRQSSPISIQLYSLAIEPSLCQMRDKLTGSYRGRVLVANNLVASTLWHRLIGLQLQSGLIQELQKLLVDYHSGRS